MDAYEATRIVFSRIQSLDPENASKIMGLLLIQDHGEKEMIRLAFGPEALVHSVVVKARKDLGLTLGGPLALGLSSSNNINNNTNSPSTPSTPPSPSPFIPNSLSRQNSRVLSNLSPSSASWGPSNLSDLQNFDDLMTPNSMSTSSASYAAVTAMNNNNNMGGVGLGGLGSSSDLIDELQLQDQLSFLNESTLGSPTIGPKNSDLFYPQQPNSASSDEMLFPPYWANHRRSCSVTDICMGSSDPLGSGLGWKPCLYFARGYCKNGTSCRFLHGLPDSSDPIVGSPGKLDVMEQCQEMLLRSKQQQQQQQQQQQLRLSASQLMASPNFPYSPGKCMNFLLQQQQNDTQRAAAAAALMLGEDFNKFNRNRLERNDFNPGSRQIYLTFPADSTFREEDVSNYFSIYGPVQDVRIPYQQKRMFGFVTFVYPETVKLILAKGNPHFVCDARVLVKPYKEKGKVPDKYRKQQQQQVERDFSACTTPTGLDSRDPYDLQLGGRLFNTTQDVLLRRKLEEQGELQQAIELQSRRFMGLQLLDVKKHHHQRNLSAPIPSPTYPYSSNINHNHNLIFQSSSSDRSSPESREENCMSPAANITPAAIPDQQTMRVVNSEKEEFNHDDNGGNKRGSPSHDDTDFHNSSLEHNLPDSPFASPTKSIGDPPSYFSLGTETAASTSLSSSSTTINNNNNNNLIASSLLPATSTLDMASFKSCFFQIPRFSSEHGAIGM